MRVIAAEYGVSNSTMRRWLTLWGIKARSKSEAAAARPAFSLATRRRMSAARRALFAAGMQPHNKGQKASVELRLKNMMGRMYTKLDLTEFADYARLKFLTYYLSKHRKELGLGDRRKMKFLRQFYNEPQFVALYEQWVAAGRCRWQRPTLDHKLPRSRGGKTCLANLQFLTWFENRAKADMTEDEWAQFKKRTGTTSRCFVRR